MQLHKGTVWATWDPEAPDFLEYIGDNQYGIDLWIDKPDGTEADLEVLGLYKWIFPSNWKFGAENFLADAYHGTTTHHSVEIVGINPGGGQSRQTVAGRAHREAATRIEVTHRGSGRLGVYFAPENFPYIPTYPNQPPAVEEYYRASYERRKQVLGKMWRVTGSNGNVFPNATQGTHSSMCVWHPDGVDSTEMWRWYFVQRDMPQEVKDMLLHYYMRYGGPIGLTEMDDMENWSYAQKASKGVIARRYPYHYAMGLGHETEGHHNLAELGLPQNALISEVMSPETRRLCSEQNSPRCVLLLGRPHGLGQLGPDAKEGPLPVASVPGRGSALALGLDQDLADHLPPALCYGQQVRGGHGSATDAKPRVYHGQSPLHVEEVHLYQFRCPSSDLRVGQVHEEGLCCLVRGGCAPLDYRFGVVAVPRAQIALYGVGDLRGYGFLARWRRLWRKVCEVHYSRLWWWELQVWSQTHGRPVRLQRQVPLTFRHSNSAQVQVRKVGCFVPHGGYGLFEPGNSVIRHALVNQVSTDVVVRVPVPRVEADGLLSFFDSVVVATHPTVRPTQVGVGFRGGERGD